MKPGLVGLTDIFRPIFNSVNEINFDYRNEAEINKTKILLITI